MYGTDQASAPFDPLRMVRGRDSPWRKRSFAVECEWRRNLHNGPRFRLGTLAPDLREDQVSIFPKRIMRKPRTLHCPFCHGTVRFARNEELLDARHFLRLGLRVVQQ